MIDWLRRCSKLRGVFDVVVLLFMTLLVILCGCLCDVGGVSVVVIVVVVVHVHVAGGDNPSARRKVNANQLQKALSRRAELRGGRTNFALTWRIKPF